MGVIRGYRFSAKLQFPGDDRGAEVEYEPYREYLVTVTEGSDKQENRQTTS
jgi:hypothetical protein